MNKKSRFLILFAVWAMLSFIIANVSAQEINVDSMDNEELTALIMQILNKLQQEEDPEAKITETPDAAGSETVEEDIQIMIYENKKLTVEALPGYMFIHKPSAGSEEGSTDPELSFSTPEDCYIYCANLDWGDNEGYAQCVKDTCGTDRPPNISSEWKR